MKKLFVLIVLLAVLAVPAFFIRNSAPYSVLRLAHALDTQDLNTVVTLADLGKFAELPVDVGVALAASSGRDVAGVVGEAIAKALGGAVGSTVKQFGGQLAAQELRKRIEHGDLTSLLGGFRPNADLRWFGGVRQMDTGGQLLSVIGTCDSKASPGQRVEVTVGVDLQPIPGRFSGYPVDWRAMGVEARSLTEVLQRCTLRFDR